jgi:hypothetical protein
MRWYSRTEARNTNDPRSAELGKMIECLSTQRE